VGFLRRKGANVFRRGKVERGEHPKGIIEGGGRGGARERGESHVLGKRGGS